MMDFVSSTHEIRGSNLITSNISKSLKKIDNK